MLAHFNGKQPWFTIEDLVVEESGTLVGIVIMLKIKCVCIGNACSFCHGR